MKLPMDDKPGAALLVIGALAIIFVVIPLTLWAIRQVHGWLQ